MYENLFTKIRIGNLTLKNRLVVPAMSTRFVGEDGKCTEQFAAYHERRAKGGWSMLITENIVVEEGVGVKRELPGLWEDGQIDGYRAMTERIHRAGAAICAQLYHAGRNTHSGITGRPNVAPSPICDPSNREIPHELTVPEILEIEERFGEAALRARKAGFDAVEIHGAHGYLAAQFLSPFSNHRSDAYGGTLENRARFGVELVRKVKEKAGEDYPVLFRISATEFLEDGMNPEQAKAVCRLLEEAGADAINCSQSGPAAFYNTVPSFFVQNGAFADLAAEIKQVVSVPVITVGRINSPLLAEELLLSGKADIIAMGRASVADPDLPKKTAEGRTEDILTCIACCQGCLGSTRVKKTLTCLVNPFAGKESECPEGEKAETPKRVVVVGGGVSGCEAAIVAAMRGHQVTLLEREPVLGGQWRAAAAAPFKGEFGSLIAWQERRLRELSVTVRLGCPADLETVKAERPDAVLLAAGSLPAVPPVPGLLERGYVTAREILLGERPFGAHPLILGGGMTGAETAEFLAGYGVEAELVELRDGIALDAEPGPRYFLLKHLEAGKVRIHTGTAVERIEEDRVFLRRENGERQALDGVDQVILAAGQRPDPSLLEELEAAGLLAIPIGDAKEAKSGFQNLQEAFTAAWNL